MVKQRFKLYRDLIAREPHFRRMAPVSLFLHVMAFVTAFGIVYWVNGPVWTLGGGGGGTGGPINVVLAASTGGAPPPPAPEEAPEPKPEPKETPKPKAEPPKAPEKVAPKPNIDPNAIPEPVKVAKTVPEKKKEEEKPKEAPKPDKKKEEKPKEPEKKTEAKKEDKPKPTPKKEAVEVLPASQKTLIAKNTGTKPGPSTQKAGGTGGEGSGGLGPPGIPNLPPGLEGWGNSVRVKVLRFWAVPPGLPMTVDNYADVEFTVDRSGNILGEPKIIKEGASIELGQSGLSAIIQTKKFPPFPTSFSGERITVVYRFSLAP